MNKLEWHGNEAMDHVRRRAVQFLTRACITVVRRAKELLSVAGTGTVGAARSAGGGGAGESGPTHAQLVRAIKANNLKLVRQWNEANKLQIEMGEAKRLRVTKAGHITGRRKARKMYWHNVGGTMVRRPRPPKS